MDIDSPEWIMLDLPADFKYLETVSSMLQTVLNRMDDQSQNSQSHFAIKLAVHEACSNIIEHAYHGNPGRIKVDVHLHTSPKKIVVELTDQGDAAVISNFVKPNLEEPKIRGYGMFLIEQLIDKVEYFREGGTNRWILVKKM